MIARSPDYGVLAAEHWTDEFSLKALKTGEMRALKDYDWGNMEKRARSFRAALLHVALESPLPGPYAAQPIVLAGEEPPAIHVLVVDDSTAVLEQHRSLVKYFSPGAKIHTCSRCEAARRLLGQVIACADRLPLSCQCCCCPRVLSRVRGAR